MNTKTFAQQARKILMQGVANKLRYWGFDTKGNVTDEPQLIDGGYIFRGEVYDDPGVVKLWQSLRAAVRRHGIDVVVEEAAYTWFNRMMAIQILSKNGYEPAQLSYAEGMAHTPVMLQRARQGQYSFLKPDEQERLRRILTDYNQEQNAFAILLIGYCHSHTLLNNVFGGIDDFTELLLPDNTLAETGFVELLNTTDAISDEEYQQVELIGWLYQFYISERKDEVFASFKKNKKAEAKDIPAATQIFTPNWIVKYMVQNTVGQLWLDLHPDSSLKAEMKYLVENHDPEAAPKAPLISEVAQLKLLDPACGSGHILVEGFDLLYSMYMAEYYTPEEAVESIFQHNLFGLDIDKRAAQLARFALFLKAAKRYPAVLRKGWMPHIYAMPEPVEYSRQEVLDFLGTEGVQYEEPLSQALLLMKEAQNLGSIMQFDLTKEAVTYLSKRLAELSQNSWKTMNEELAYIALAPAVEILVVLGQKYEAVVANPPYMGSGNMNETLKKYANSKYPKSKADLYAVFMEVCLNLNVPSGLMGMINQHGWMFLSSYEALRKHIIEKYRIVSMLHLGPRTFEELSGEVVQSTAFVLEKGQRNMKGTYYRLVDYKQVNLKEENFSHRNNGYSNISQSNYSKVPGSPIAYWVSEKMKNLFNDRSLSDIAFSDGKNVTGNNDKYLKFFWEVNSHFIGKSKKWLLLTKGGRFRRWYGNTINVIDWSTESRNFYRKSKIGRIIPEYLWYKRGITWSKIASTKSSFRYLREDSTYDEVNISFHDESFLEVILGFLNSNISTEIFKILNPTFSFQTEDILSLPIISEINRCDINNIVSKCFSISRIDWDSHETSWDFQGTPLNNKLNSLNQSYLNWQESIRKDFFQLHTNEEELNRIFIDIYGLQEELTPEVALKDITILQDELDSKALEQLEPVFRKGEPIELPIKRDVVMQQIISYAMGIFMGRYRLDQPGLHIAHPNPTKEEIAPYSYNGHTVAIDEDAIIPLMGSDCDFSDDAVMRFKEFLDTVWGEETRIENINFLQECLDQDLEKYIVNGFWKSHCSMYKKKPIYWLFASPKGAFQVLVYMHRMNAFTVEKIRANYLMEHLKSLRHKIAALEKESSRLSTQEAKRLDKLRKDLLECEQYDLALKDVADRQITFDLDNGVTENYKLFKGVVAEIK